MDLSGKQIWSQCQFCSSKPVAPLGGKSVKIVMVLASLLVALLSSGGHGAPKCTPATLPGWLADSLTEMETIHGGTTREDLLKVFRPAGGFSSSSRVKGVFVYRDSPYISINVEFAHIQGGVRRQRPGEPARCNYLDLPAVPSPPSVQTKARCSSWLAHLCGFRNGWGFMPPASRF